MTVKRKKLILVGNGMAGVRAIEHLLKLAPEAYEITIFGTEPYPNYNRIMLSSVLAGGASLDEIVINDLEWYRSFNITLYTGHTVTSINTAARTVNTDKGVTAAYDELILATGSNPFMLPIPEQRRRALLPSVTSRILKSCRTYRKNITKR